MLQKHGRYSKFTSFLHLIGFLHPNYVMAIAPLLCVTEMEIGEFIFGAGIHLGIVDL